MSVVIARCARWVAPSIIFRSANLIAPRPAPRPAYSVLAVERFEDIVGRRVEPWLHGLGDYLDTLGERS